MLQIQPIGPLFGARVTGLDLSCPPGEAEFAGVREALERYSVLVFHNQAIDDAAQVAFSERFGPLETTRAGANGAGGKLIVLTNIGPDRRIAPPTDKQVLNNRANQSWHHDSSFKLVPARASMLSAREIPREGGNTEFANLRVAYATLPEDLRERYKARRWCTTLAGRALASSPRWLPRPSGRTGRRCVTRWWWRARMARPSTSVPMPAWSKAWRRQRGGR